MKGPLANRGTSSPAAGPSSLLAHAVCGTSSSLAASFITGKEGLQGRLVRRGRCQALALHIWLQSGRFSPSVTGQ